MSGQISTAGLMPAAQDSTMASPDQGAAISAWYVAYTEPHQEPLALRHLMQQGFEAYLPLYKTIRKRASRPPMETGTTLRLIVHEPMFPRYMFFKPSSHRQSISTVRSTRGVSSVVRFGTEYALVQPQVIAAIQEQEQLRNGADLEAMGALKPGRRVRIHEAGMDGLEGLVHATSSKRLVVLMEILGRQTKVKVNRAAVEPI